MEEGSLFRFKKFSMHHHLSSMKIGVDAVLLGAWISEKSGQALEVGSGCGVISLMAAQRMPFLNIEAIDIDIPSVEETKENFRNSPWAHRLQSLNESFNSLCERMAASSYDIIFSNPPYYNAGIEQPSSPRLRARHQGELNPWILFERSEGLLKEDGILAMVLPYDHMSQLEVISGKGTLKLSRLCRVKSFASKEPKRVLVEFHKGIGIQREETDLVLYERPSEPTDSYKELCKEFYLKF